MNRRDYPTVQEVKSGKMIGYNGYNEVWLIHRKTWEIVPILRGNECFEYVEEFKGSPCKLTFAFHPETGEPIPIKVPEYLKNK